MSEDINVIKEDQEAEADDNEVDIAAATEEEL